MCIRDRHLGTRGTCGAVGSQGRAREQVEVALEQCGELGRVHPADQAMDGIDGELVGDEFADEGERRALSLIHI